MSLVRIEAERGRRLGAVGGGQSGQRSENGAKEAGDMQRWPSRTVRFHVSSRLLDKVHHRVVQLRQRPEILLLALVRKRIYALVAVVEVGEQDVRAYMQLALAQVTVPPSYPAWPAFNSPSLPM